MKLFEDLPSQNTPITAENLNQIKDNLVVVSATEPTGDNREKVWIQKGKNLFNPKTDIEGVNKYRSYMDGILTDANDFYSFRIKVEPNTTYTASSDLVYSSWHNLCFFDEKMNVISGNIFTGENKTFTTPTNCNYITIAVHNTYTWFQLEQGTIATAYEEYVEPKIYVKNGNDVYEEFISKDNLDNYSTEEQKTGTWIDGRYLYRKVITYNQYLNKDIVISIPHNIENFKTLVKISANMEWEDGFYPFPTHYENQQNEIVVNSIDKTNINITSYGENWGAQTLYFILEYTKTTD